MKINLTIQGSGKVKYECNFNQGLLKLNQNINLCETNKNFEQHWTLCAGLLDFIPLPDPNLEAEFFWHEILNFK